MYVVSEDGEAVTASPELLLRLLAGDQVYVAAPVAASKVESPVQIESAEAETSTSGAVVTLMVTAALLLHPLSVSVTVYVMLEEGFAVTEVPEEELSPVAGVQVKLPAPEAVSVTASLEQMEADDGETVTTGGELTVTVTLAVSFPRQPIMLPVTI